MSSSPVAPVVMNAAIVGPPGAGKGTHAATLSARYGLCQVSTGNLFRHHLRTRTALGLLARRYLQQGELVPDEMVEAMIEEWCEQVPLYAGILFTGFPRTIGQVRFLENLLSSQGRRLDALIYLDVPDDEASRRISGRLVCHQCQAPYHATQRPPRKPGCCDLCGGEIGQRPDDGNELVRARLGGFHRAVGPVVEHFAARRRLLIVPGVGPVSEVESRLVSAFDSLAQRTAPFANVEDAAQLRRQEPETAFSLNLARPTLDVVLLGGPGSGKGTQAEHLAAEFKLPHIATGDLFRENFRLATELGRLAKTYMDRGELVPDNVTDAMVSERVARADAAAGFILDGFPRTLHQAHALVDIMAQQNRRLAGVLHIKVSDDEIVRRLSGRLICRQCQSPYHTAFKPPHKTGVCDRCGGELYQRSDDNPETIRARLATFHLQTEPLIAFYRDAGLLLEIDGEGDLADVTARGIAAVRRFQSFVS